MKKFLIAILSLVLAMSTFGSVAAFAAEQTAGNWTYDDTTTEVTDATETGATVTQKTTGTASSVTYNGALNLETGANPDMKAPDTMGMKHRVDRGVYVTYGSINVQPAEKTGFSEEDAQALKEALRTIFRNDATAARPDGSMEVVKLIWWEHNCPNGQYSAAKVHRSVQIEAGKDGMPRVSVDETAIPGLKYTLIDGE